MYREVRLPIYGLPIVGRPHDKLRRCHLYLSTEKHDDVCQKHSVIESRSDFLQVVFRSPMVDQRISNFLRLNIIGDSRAHILLGLMFASKGVTIMDQVLDVGVHGNDGIKMIKSQHRRV